MVKKTVLALTVLFLLCGARAYADLGVGINNGKIVVTQKLKPGAVYKLPQVTVFNTGTIDSDYQVSIQYDQNQTELKPSEKWFMFSPSTFSIPAHKAQNVNATLIIPIDATPGKYFAFIDAHPVVGSLNGVTTVGIAAGSKLYFTVVPANLVDAMFYRSTQFFTVLAPWSYIAIGIIILIILVFIARKKLKFQIGVQKK